MQSYHYKQLQAYQQARVNVGKAQQVVLLYDGIIRFLQQAEQAENEKNIADRCTLLNKTITIIMGLQACLDMENYPEISAMLYDYYETIYIRMQALQQGGNVEEYQALIADIKQMRDAWAATDEDERAKAMAAPSVVATPSSVAAEMDEFIAVAPASDISSMGSFAFSA